MIKINFVVRDKQIYNDQALQISIPTLDGEITVLDGHIPLVTVVRSGELKIIDIKGQEHSYAITRGVVNVRNRSLNKEKEEVKEMETEVLLMCDDAIASDAIDIATEEVAIKRAEEVIKNGESYQDISGLISPLEKELNRIRIAKRR